MDCVFLHGWGQDARIWRQLLAALPVTAHTPELPGHGQRAWTAPFFDLDPLVDMLAAEAPRQCQLIGWSLGGMLALRWAQRHPQQISRLALIGSTPCFGQRRDWAPGTDEYTQTQFACRTLDAPEDALAYFADLMLLGDDRSRATRKIARALYQDASFKPAALSAALSFLAKTDLRATIAAAPPHQPTLILHGKGDTIVPPAAGEWLAAQLPQSRFVCETGWGHAPMLSHPAELAAALHDFLDG